VGLAGGLVMLAAINLARIVSLYHVSARWSGWFDVVHTELWPLAMVAFTLAAFLAWTRWAGDAGRARP